MVRREGFPLENTATTKLILSVSMACMAVIGKFAGHQNASERTEL